MTTATLTGRYALGDLTGRDGEHLRFTPSTTIVGPDVIVLPDPVPVTLDTDGSFTVELVTTDSPDFAPTGWVWVVQELMDGGRAPWAFELTANSDISDLTAVATPDQVEYSALASTSVIAGAGLTGGGTLAADRTFAVGAGTGITVNAEDIAVQYGTTAGTAAQGNDSRITGAAAAIAPRMVLAPHRTSSFRRVLYHEGATLYACTQTATGTVWKSTDNGATWATLGGALGWEPRVLIRLATGTLLAIEEALAPRAARSTDNGATWAAVTTGANFAPLGSTGIVETTSGYVMFGEYGNVANTVYRVLRSTNDGVTWAAVLSSPGTDPLSDPGHIHSITWDKVAAKLVAYMDRPSPEIYASSDEGATWSKIGTATTVNMPNFVAPMYFADYVAWGFDNDNNGKIARLPRADFYAGNWGGAEIVATVNGKALYETFPIDEDTWLISGATEKIGTSIEYAGAYTQEIVIIYSNGSKVAPGVEHATPTSSTNALDGQKARFPVYKFSEYDHSERSWVNLTTAGVPYAYASMPFTVSATQGALGSQQTWQAPAGPLVIHNNGGIWSRDLAGTLRQVVVLDGQNYLRLQNPVSAVTPEVRITDSAAGVVAFVASGVNIGRFIGDGRLQMTDANYIEMGSTGTPPRIYSGTGSPEGVKAAPPGSLWLNRSGGANVSLYVKESGTGTTGWVGK